MEKKITHKIGRDIIFLKKGSALIWGEWEDDLGGRKEEEQISKLCISFYFNFVFSPHKAVSIIV